MRDSDDQDKQFFAIDNIEDAVFSHPEPSPTRKPAIQWRDRVRTFAEGINGAANALSARLMYESVTVLIGYYQLNPSHYSTLPQM